MDQWGYSKQTAAQIAAVLQDMDYKYQFQDELGVFQLRFDLRSCGLRNVPLFILIEKKMYTSCAICPLRIPQDKMKEAAEYITRINRRIHLGMFWLDFDTGELRARCDIPFRGIMPWPDVVEQSIRLPVELFEQFGNGLLSVIYGKTSPAETAQREIERQLRA